jgi:hypothetical protein
LFDKYQTELAFGDQIIKSEVSGPSNRFKPVTYLYLSKTRIWISISICRNIFCVQLFEVRGTTAVH